MSNEAKVGQPKIQAYAIVYDKNGMPRIDNPQDVPDEVWDQLTDHQKHHANIQVMEHLRRWD